VDKVLSHLMTNGIKVEGGDKLGKTIIFAKSHKHAVFIEERFNKKYPEYAGKFLRVIDNYESKAQDLLEAFVDAYQEREPQIAVSVDMMDTGVDAPRVVNLVFFKAVKSPTKFWQMIGRGTRLCPNLFGIGEDKKEFAIFDFCENFEFFDENPDGLTNKAVKSLTQQTFEAKLAIATFIREHAETTDKQNRLAEAYLDELFHAVSALNHDRFEVKAKLRLVSEYTKKKRWQNLTKSDVLDLNTHISQLIQPSTDDDEQARRFDVLILNYQLALLQHAYSTDSYINRITRVGAELLKKLNIPEVAQQKNTLQKIETDTFWENININDLDEVRTNLRSLMKYLDKESRLDIVTTFIDTIDDTGIYEPDLIDVHTNLKTYRERVEAYVRRHDNHIIIQKIKRNQPITPLDIETLEALLFDGDQLGSKKDYEKAYGDKPLGEFIRSIVGLDKAAVQEAFSNFINNSDLSANQVTFVDQIIRYLTTNGVMEKSILFEPPFTNIHDQGLLGVFCENDANTVIELIQQVNTNAVASSAAS
jgi:type I restriction enzyme R subunit